ncbi:MAG: hypothetical protein ACD_50C00076G0002 [uncultured bacterium]|nr:MAG: hypothetical protein ACD_50C00076G0002 [uncultured bacterium]
MRLFFTRLKFRTSKKKITDYKQEDLKNFAAGQFKELSKKGLEIKVALL